MSRIVRALGIVLILSVLHSAHAWSAPALPRVVLRFDTTADGAQAPFSLALARGWYTAEGVEAVLEAGNGPEDAALAVQDGRADVGMADTFAVLSLRARGMPLRVVAGLGDRSPLCVFSLPAAGVSRPGDLAGRKVGVDPLGLPRALFPLLCRASGLRQEDVTFIPMDSARRLQALAGGAVDAVLGTVSEGPALGRALGKPGVSVLLWADSGFTPYGPCLFVRDDAVTARARPLGRFLTASFRGWRAALARPEDAVAAFRKQRVVETAGLAEEISALAPLFMTRAYRTLGIGWIDGKRMEEMAAAAAELLGATLAGPAGDAFSTALLPRTGVLMPARKPAGP